MRSVVMIKLLLFAREAFTIHSHSSVEKVLDELVNHLLDPMFKVWSSHYMDMENGTLGKLERGLIRSPLLNQVFRLPLSCNRQKFSVTIDSGPKVTPIHSSAGLSRPRPCSNPKANPEHCLAAAEVGGAKLDAASRVLSWVVENGGGSSVRPGVNTDGIRGLVAEHASNVGDVLLEVPLSLSMCHGNPGITPLAGSTPEWTWKLPWNVQLALAVLERRGSDEADPFLESWPDTPPHLPIECEMEDIAMSGDRELSVLMDQACFWINQQYSVARETAAAAQGATVDADVRFPSASAFRDAMALVWSRSLRATTDEHVDRHLLVPALDLANHEPIPSATFAFANGSRCGPSIRLYAVRPLQPGDAVTITYGEHISAHFAGYYGFVPTANPFDSICISLPDILSATPAEVLGLGAAAIEGLNENDKLRQFDLRPGAPSAALLKELLKIIPGGHAAAARALVWTVAAIECGSFNLTASSMQELDAEAAEAMEKDKQLLASASLAEQTRIFIKLRLERRLLLSSLRRAMRSAARRCDQDPVAGGQELDALAAKFEISPPVYPGLGEIGIEEFEQKWARRAWDWQANAWA